MGGGGAGGAGLAPMRGAISLNVLKPEGCSLEEKSYDYPGLPGGHPVTATGQVAFFEDETTRADGEKVEVLCDWTGTDE